MKVVVVLFLLVTEENKVNSYSSSTKFGSGVRQKIFILFKLLCIFIQVELQEKIRMYMSKSLTARSNSLRR